MKIYQCDRCGKTKTVSKIVGTEFDYYGYKTLSISLGHIHDVCASCFDKIQAAYTRGRDESKCSAYQAAKEAAFSNDEHFPAPVYAKPRTLMQRLSPKYLFGMGE